MLIKHETMPELHSDLEPASLGVILDPLEWFVLLPIHVQPVHLEPTHSQLADSKLEAVKRKYKGMKTMMMQT